MRESPSELRQPLFSPVRASWTAGDWKRAGVIAGVSGALLAAAGAFGTAGAPLGVRLVYWVGLILAGTGLARIVQGAIARIAALEQRPISQLVCGTFVLSALLTLVVWSVSLRVLPDAGRPDLLGYFPTVLVVSAAMTTLNVLAARQPVETHAAPAGTPPPRFLDRLPARLKGADLHAVQAEDHYLRLHTDRGSDLILMRLAEAIAELDGLEGAQTHRSWWVARAGVESARREGGRVLLRLKSGAEVPISRTYVRALRDEGWLS